MGKSPGKWIKSLLFGKKSFRPRSSKGRDVLNSASENAVSGGNGLPASIRNASPVISGSLPVSTSNPELEKETPSRLGCNASPEPFKERIQQKNGIVATFAADNSEKSREDQAATMVQAAFRGYLARRAFYVLKGIIRLQALMRGHLVRRQAVSTIHSMLAIIKFQAVFRGHRVRASGSGVEVCSKFRAVVIKRMDSQEKLYAHKLVCKLLSSSIISMPLQIHYVQNEPNSAYSWMERWTFSGFWKSVLQPRKVIETKPHAKKSTYAMETESIRLKRNVRKSPSGGDAGSSVTSDLEKPKRSIRKIYSPSLDSATENQPSELEKVKRNLRKISSSILGTDDGENGSEKSLCNPNKLSNEQPDVPNQIIDAPMNEIKHEDELTLMKEKESIAAEGKGSTSNDCCGAEMNQSQSMDRYANPEMNDGLDFKEEQISHENHNSRKRTSLSAKSEYSDNSVQNTRTLPSYMAATESAKAKLRTQISPRFASESAEKNGIIRRHSLPSSTNGKLASFSPRSQRPVQGLAKGVINNRCLLSSRDGNEKLIQVEWRR